MALSLIEKMIADGVNINNFQEVFEYFHNQNAVVDLSEYYNKLEIDGLLEGIGSGTGNYTFSVTDMDLQEYAESTSSVLEFIPGATNTLEGTIQQGTVHADEAGNINCFFDTQNGEFSVALDQLNMMSLLTFKTEKPTQMAEFDPMSEMPADPAISIYFVGGSIYIALVEGASSSNQISITVENNVGKISFKRISNKSFEVYFQGELQETINANGILGNYAQTLNTKGMLPIQQFTFDLTKALAVSGYTFPEAIQDGLIYRLLNGGVLFNKEVQMNDFIQFYDNKSNIIITRVPEKVEFPEPIKPVEYFRGKFYDQGDVQNIPDPKAGDYILYNDNSSNLTLFVYDPDISNWKSTVSPSNYRGYYGEISPSIPNSKAGDFIVMQSNSVFAVAFYNPVVGRYVSIIPENTDQIAEGGNNLYYSDDRVINRLVYFFSGTVGHSAFKSFFDSYVNNLILKKNATYATILNKNLLELSADNLSPVLTDFVHERNQIEWANVSGWNGWYRISENTPVGTYDIWTHKNTMPDRRYFKLEFKLSFRDNIPAEIHIGLGIHNGNELYEIGGVIAKYDHLAEERFTFWFRRYFTGELVQLKSPTIVVKNKTLYFIGMDGNFILGNQNYDRNVLSIFVQKTNVASDILIGGVKLTLLEEVVLPYNQYDQ